MYKNWTISIPNFKIDSQKSKQSEASFEYPKNNPLGRASAPENSLKLINIVGFVCQIPEILPK